MATETMINHILLKISHWEVNYSITMRYSKTMFLLKLCCDFALFGNRNNH